MSMWRVLPPSLIIALILFVNTKKFYHTMSNKNQTKNFNMLFLK